MAVTNCWKVLAGSVSVIDPFSHSVAPPSSVAEQKSQSPIVGLGLVPGVALALDHPRFEHETLVASGLKGAHKLLHRRGQPLRSADRQKQFHWRFLVSACKFRFLFEDITVAERHRRAGRS